MIHINKLIANSINITNGPKLDEPLCFTAKEAGSSVSLSNYYTNNGYPVVRLRTSTDGTSWNDYTVNDTITLTNVGDKVYFKANY